MVDEEKQAEELVAKVEEPAAEEPTTEEAWSPDREWPPDDERWTEKAKVHREGPAPSEEARTVKDRGSCPMIPKGNYLLMTISKIEFLLESIVVPNVDDPSGSALHAPLMKIIAIGPAVTDYKPGDMILTHPRNPELQLAWRDPRAPAAENAYFFMKDEFVMAHYDSEVIEQMRRRARYLFKKQTKQKNFDESPLNPKNSAPKIVLHDALDEPLTKKGMQDSPLDA